MVIVGLLNLDFLTLVDDLVTLLVVFVVVVLVLFVDHLLLLELLVVYVALDLLTVGLFLGDLLALVI